MDASTFDWDGVSILVTGATGKVGRRLVSGLLSAHARVAVLTRDPTRVGSLWPDAPVEPRQADLTQPATLTKALDGIEAVIHLASYSPGANEAAIYEAPAHWPTTVVGTQNLVEAAARSSSLKRLVYVSSVKAMGDAVGAKGTPADETAEPQPDSLYGRAKLRAEQEVLRLGMEAGRHVAVLRLPMVYGLDTGEGNIGRMIDAVARGRFPPWPRIENRRSAVHVEDVVRAAMQVLGDPRASGQVYLLTDGRPYSTRWLYEQIFQALGRPLPHWCIPLWLLNSTAALGTLTERLTGRAMPLTQVGLSKLTGDAWYSSDKIQSELGFRPGYSLEREIPRVVAGYRGARPPTV